MTNLKTKDIVLNLCCKKLYRPYTAGAVKLCFIVWPKNSSLIGGSAGANNSLFSLTPLGVACL